MCRRRRSRRGSRSFRCSLATLPAQLRGCLLVDGKGQVLEAASEDDAVVTLGTFDGDVLVEDVVEHGLRVAVERVAPTAAAAVVVDETLAGFERDPVSGVLDYDGVR